MKLRFFLICLCLSAAAWAWCGLDSDGWTARAPTLGLENNTEKNARAEEGNDNATELNVISVEDPFACRPCQWPEICVRDYFDFLNKAAPYAAPITETELNRRIADIENGLVVPWSEPVPDPLLRSLIDEALNLDFLLNSLDQRPLIVTTVRKSETLFHRRWQLLFTDPYIGTFDGVLLVPKGVGPHPAVVAIHGHRDDAGIYLRRHHGRKYPSHGLAILALTMRGMGIDVFEHETSKVLLLAGHTLIGMRVYETLLALKYLRWRGDIDPERIGLIGHSGGSSTSNLTVRIEPRFKAYVSDFAVDYCEWGTLLEPWHCETVPNLFPYHLLIRDFSTCSTPVLEVPYGYTDSMAEIFSFFKSHLGR